MLKKHTFHFYIVVILIQFFTLIIIIKDFPLPEFFLMSGSTLIQSLILFFILKILYTKKMKNWKRAVLSIVALLIFIAFTIFGTIIYS